MQEYIHWKDSRPQSDPDSTHIVPSDVIQLMIYMTKLAKIVTAQAPL